jgi:hypothetical protein
MPEIGPIQSAATTPGTTGGPPVDHASEAPAIVALQRRGFGARFVADGEHLRVADSDRRFRPDDVRIVDFYRFEGTSDPDDMSVVYALEASDGTRGLLIDAFGSYADPAVGALTERMRIDRPTADAARRARRRPAWIGGALAAALIGAAAVWRRRRRRGDLAA